MMDLKKFAQKMFELINWPDCSTDIDIWEFQEVAEECGLLIKEIRHEPCCKNCLCAEYFDDMSIGVTCYRKNPDLIEKK